MKLETIKKKITFYFSVSGVILLALSAGIYFYLNNQTDDSERLSSLKSEKEKLEAEISILQQELEESKKYQESFKILTKNQKTLSAAKTGDTNSFFNKIAKKYLIKNQDIQFSAIEQVKEDVINTKAIIVNKVIIDIKFDAYSDMIALQVLDEFVEFLEGYAIVQSLSLNKVADYSNDDIIDISKGTAKPAVSLKSTIIWYSLEMAKPAESLEPQQPNP